MVSFLVVALAALVFPGKASRLPGACAAGPPGSDSARQRTGRSVAGGLPLAGRAGGSGTAVRRVIQVLAAALLAAALVVVGPAGAVAAAAAVLTAGVLVRRSLAARRRRAALVDVSVALRMLGRELRAGADPAAAAARVAPAARGAGAEVLHSLLQLVRAGDRSDVGPPGVPVDPAGSDPGSYALFRLAGGWQLSSRYGVAWAPLVDALARDLAEQSAADAQRAGQLAGPRTSGYVMAALPLLGLALGVSMGADPVRVLLFSPSGSILLPSGVTLICLGLLWASRIVGR